MFKKNKFLTLQPKEKYNRDIVLTPILFFIFIRPFISSFAFYYANFIFSACLLIFLLIWLLQNLKSLKQIKPLKFQICFFISAIVISYALSQDKIISTGEIYKYATGILLLFLGASLSYKDKNRAILWLIASGLIISFLAIYQYFLGFHHISNYAIEQKITIPFTWDYINQSRVFLPFMTPNILGGYLAMIIPLVLTIKFKTWLAIPFALALFFTKSLGALISLLLGLMIFFYMQKRLNKRKFFILAVILTTTVSIFVARGAIEKKHLTPIYSTLNRLNYWEGTIKVIKEHPLKGVGIGNFNLPSSRYAHNSYLQILAELGILGLASFLWLIFSIFKSSLKGLKDPANKPQLIGLISLSSIFLFHNIIDFSFFLPEVSMIWWLVLGISYSYQNSNKI